jgi:hypothetical protein
VLRLLPAREYDRCTRTWRLVKDVAQAALAADCSFLVSGLLKDHYADAVPLHLLESPQSGVLQAPTFDDELVAADPAEPFELLLGEKLRQGIED